MKTYLFTIKFKAMNKHDICTIEDLLRMEERLTKLIESKLHAEDKNEKVNYVRSNVIRQKLSITDNTLRALRTSNSIPWSYIGSIYYYPLEEIEELLKNNTIK